MKQESFRRDVQVSGPNHRSEFDLGPHENRALQARGAEGAQPPLELLATYGPRMHANDGRVVSNFIVQALKGLPISLYGTGAQTRSFCYVDDLIEGIVRLMGTPDEVTGPMNMGNPVEFSIRALAERVIELTGSSSKLVFQPLPADDPRQRKPDISQAQSILGWEPRTQLDMGLKATIAYFENVLTDRKPRQPLERRIKSAQGG